MAGRRATREVGLQRIGTATRFLAVGGLVAGGVLSAAVAKALPGHSSHPGSSTATTVPSQSAGGGDGSQSTNNAALNPPVQAPTPVTAPPVVSSGGS